MQILGDSPKTTRVADGFMNHLTQTISINHNFANATTRLVLLIAFPTFTRTDIRVWFLLWKVSRVYRYDSSWFNAYTCYGTLWSVFSRHAVILQVITEARNHHRSTAKVVCSTNRHRRETRQIDVSTVLTPAPMSGP